MNQETVVGPHLRKVLFTGLVLFSLLMVDSVYLGSVTFLEWYQGTDLQAEFSPYYQGAFLAHLILGFLILVPALLFAAIHLSQVIHRPNRLAVRLGLTLLVVLVLMLVSGILLTRGLPGFEIQAETTRTWLYWLHVVTPLFVCWLFVLHRLAGPAINWNAGASVGLASVALCMVVLLVSQNTANEEQKAAGQFLPSLAKTASGQIIEAHHLMQDEYCAGCHADTHASWAVSAHRFASFNNPAYLFSVRKTREMALARDGNVDAARFCAGCHDPVPLFTGAFDDPAFDDVNHPTAQAGITCTACHAIEEVSSTRGNADYVIGTPAQYPFTYADNSVLQWLNGVLIKGKPALHKRTYLKPLHESAEFCSTCHKVHLPEALNAYQWLRGQNHYDSFLLSGFSGHGIESFNYPETAVDGCADCHMPLMASGDLGARFDGDKDDFVVHNHQFPAANTALASMVSLPEMINDAHREMLQGSLRVDIFALREGQDIDAPLTAPLGNVDALLETGSQYLFDIVIRNLKTGHRFTEGTADSNQVWLEVWLEADGEVVGHSGAIDADSVVDPWSHFVNTFAIDRDGNHINRRNAEDIFTQVYDHQIDPGAADVVHYRLRAPEAEQLTVHAALRYRKFNTAYFRMFMNDPSAVNDLPVVTIASDSLVLSQAHGDSAVAEWERWNDYGIAMLLKPSRSGLRQAEQAFREVIALGRPEGHLNLARTFLEAGRLIEAAEQLRLAAAGGADPWSVTYFSGLVDLRSGRFESALDQFHAVAETRFTEARERGFDFSMDYRLLNTIARTYFDASKRATDIEREHQLLEQAESYYQKTLALDMENLAAHYGLYLVYSQLGNEVGAKHHQEQHERFRPDDNARDSAVRLARQKYPAADHAAEAFTIYDLNSTEQVN